MSDATDKMPAPQGSRTEPYCAAVIIALLTCNALGGAVGHELERIAQGDLFFLALPGEAAASAEEIDDARVTAETWKRPAVLFAAMVGIVAPFLAVRLLLDGSWTEVDAALVVFVIAALADAASTIAVFETNGIVQEVHPAVKLLGYAYGRFAGAALSKLVQVMGVAGIVQLVPAWRFAILIVASLLYFVAAGFNCAAVGGWW